MPIPYAITYTATVAGRICKAVPCESCGATFFYEMVRSAAAASTSVFFLDTAGAKDRASNEAEKNLRQTLASEFDIVPCPHCGHYQDCMTPAVRSKHLAWLLAVGIVLLLVAMAFFAGYLLMYFSSSYTAAVLLRMRVCLAAAAATGVPGLGMLIAKFVLARRYDPNNPAELAKRLELARSRCIPYEEFEKLMEAAIEKAVQEMKSASELPEFLRRKRG